ncbi:MAG: hypothetical protein Q6K80_10405 [Thermostichus sp. DG_1_6_bins_120]
MRAAAPSSIPTTEMQVTSIRLERELKEQLKSLAGDQGYQALVRQILWNYVHRHSGEHLTLSPTDIQASFPARAHQAQRCALTGQPIQPQEPMLLGWTGEGQFVPLSLSSLQSP